MLWCIMFIVLWHSFFHFCINILNSKNIFALEIMVCMHFLRSFYFSVFSCLYCFRCPIFLVFACDFFDAMWIGGVSQSIRRALWLIVGLAQGGPGWDAYGIAECLHQMLLSTPLQVIQTSAFQFGPSEDIHNRYYSLYWGVPPLPWVGGFFSLFWLRKKHTCLDYKIQKEPFWGVKW